MVLFPRVTQLAERLDLAVLCPLEVGLCQLVEVEVDLVRLEAESD